MNSREQSAEDVDRADSLSDSSARLIEEFRQATERMYQLGRQHQAELDRHQAECDAEIAQIKASRRMVIDYIRGPVGEGYIYVITFTTGVVKVGQTEDPIGRLNNHQSRALALGVGATNYWISPPHRNYKDNETKLIALCSKVSRRSRLEYFHEVGYERAAQFARDLEFDSAISDQPAVECGWS